MQMQTRSTGIFVVNSMTGVTVSPASTIAGDAGLVTVAFTNAITIPVGGKITIQFPTGFSAASTAVTAGVGVDTSSAVSSSGVLVTITVAGSSVVAGTAKSLTINGVTNPGIS